MTITLTGAIFKNIYFWVIIVCLVIIAGGAGFYLYKLHPQVLGMFTAAPIDPTGGQLTANQIQQVLAQVSKLIVLPSGETPTVATITDISKLTGQDFFKLAHNGDQVLIYPQSRRVYLYSPSLNKILDVQTITTASPSVASATPTPTPIPVESPTAIPTP